jgi:TonB family protein
MSAAESTNPDRSERLRARAASSTSLALAIALLAFAVSPTRAEAEGETSAKAPASVRLTRPADPGDYYPEAAKAQNVSGMAVVEVDVDPQGKLVDARVVNVDPADPQFGFADAALEVARNTAYENSGAQTGSVKFMVKFALEDPAANPAAAPTPASAMKLPRIVGVANPDDYYPPKARRAGVGGMGLVEVAVDPSGKVVNVTVLEVDPVHADYDFGKAAERVARANKYANPYDETLTIKFRVKFTPRR